MGLIEDIGAGPVALDTAIFIYLIEEHPRFLPLVEPVFAAVDAGRWPGVTSGLTLLEVLVVPYRAGDLALAEQYETLLTRSRGIRMVEVDAALLRSGAQLRALTRMRAPDALQVAAALRTRSTAYLTNDRRLPAAPGLRVLQLRDYLRPREGRLRPGPADA
ncbi:MAG TPA: PIN domain-containing protein [Gemmatimonadales bacterium]|nr:PIN domain-containing protein [Gemmatimonadales bacterium]